MKKITFDNMSCYYGKGATEFIDGASAGLGGACL